MSPTVEHRLAETSLATTAQQAEAPAHLLGTFPEHGGPTGPSHS